MKFLKKKIFIFEKKVLIFVSLISVFLLVFVLGVFFGMSWVECKVCKPEEIDFSLFWETYHMLKERFPDSGKINTQEIIYGAISGMVKSLGDPYTVFLKPEETKRFQQDVKGVFEGVGMEIGMKKGELTVISPLEGTPAQRSGIRAGDKIIKIDETFTIDLTIEEAVALIRGQSGTEVTLTVLRKDWENPKEIKLIREVIEIPSLKWELREGNIAYLKLYNFTEKAQFDFPEAAVEILNS